MPKKFPYVTTNRWNPLKRQVFSFREAVSAESIYGIFADRPYIPFVAIDDVYPEHLEDDGPMRFYDQIRKEKKVRLERFKYVIDWREGEPKDYSNELDRIGEFFSLKIEPRKNISKRGRYFNGIDEMWVDPIWHSISIDIALLLAECSEKKFIDCDPRWVPPTSRVESLGSMDYPKISFRTTDNTDPMDPAETKLIQLLSDRYSHVTNRDIKKGEWLDVFDDSLVELHLNKDEFDANDYSPDIVNNLVNFALNEGLFYPFDAAWFFLMTALSKRYLPETLTERQMQLPHRLGDCLRQEKLPNWSGFPKLH